MNIFQGIIDIYDGNTEIDLEDAWKRGVRAILHETSRGLYKKKDRAYLERKKAALDMGFLWAGYHLVSSEDVNEQLKVFLAMEDGSDPRIGMAIDWEKTSKGIASGDQIRELVERFNTTMKPRYPDRYPILYGGNLIREDEGIQKGDALLAKCPLWYAFLNANPLTNKKYPFPRKTWSTYTLWQFDDEKRQHGAPPPNVLPGADWNRFQGTEDDLRNAWPFGGLTAGGVLPVHPLTNEVITAAAPPVPGFAGRAAAIALQEWDFWGKQTYDLNGHATLVGHKEMQPGWYERVGIYWDQGVRIHGVDGRNRDWAWSAAFISWVMRTAGQVIAFAIPSNIQYTLLKPFGTTRPRTKLPVTGAFF
jgi:lysozyme